jgi:hypothetical protein
MIAELTGTSADDEHARDESAGEEGGDDSAGQEGGDAEEREKATLRRLPAEEASLQAEEAALTAQQNQPTTTRPAAT